MPQASDEKERHRLVVSDSELERDAPVHNELSVRVPGYPSLLRAADCGAWCRLGHVMLPVFGTEAGRSSFRFPDQEGLRTSKR